MNDCGLKSEISPISKSIMQFSGGDSGGNESDRGFLIESGYGPTRQL